MTDRERLRAGDADRLRVGDASHLRVGDAERDEVATALHEHFARGRLSREELDERLTAALSARTVGDLREVTRDLPADPVASLPVTTARARRPGRGRPPWHAGVPGFDDPMGGHMGGPLAGGPFMGRPHPGGPPWAWHAGARRMAYGGRRPHPGPPAGVFLIALFLILAFTGGWFLFPLFALVWCAMVFAGIRHARRWHRPYG